MEDKPSTVPATAPQGGDIRARWAWVEPAVWTDPMLTALEQGVKGGKWFRLIDKVFSEKNLLASHRKVEANRGAPGVDHVTIEEFSRQLGPNLENLTAALRGGTYRPQAIRRVFIPKPGGREQRPLGIPTVRDRVGRARCAMCWNRSSSGNSPSRVMASAPEGVARMLCAEWTTC